MGLISYVGDSAVALSVYTTEKDLTDLRNIGPEDWTPTDTTRYVTVNDQTEYYHARGDALIQIPRADLAVGDFILVRTADGVLQIIRIPSAEGEPSAGAVENEAVPTAIPDPAALTAEEG